MNTQKSEIVLSKASLQLGAWGLVMLVGGAMSQWFNLSADFLLVLWGGATVLGLAGQIVGLVRGMNVNLAIWIGLILVGWLFTLYVTKFENGVHVDLYGDLAGVWLVLLGLGYIATALQVDKRFFVIAALHLLVGGLVELSARQIVSIAFVDANSSLLVGLVGGLPLLVAALPVLQVQPNRQRTSVPNGPSYSQVNQ